MKHTKFLECRIENCNSCKLSLTQDNKNIFVDIANELDMNTKERYLVLPNSICAREILIHHNPWNWEKKIDNLIDEMKDVSVDDSYEFILNKFPNEINNLRETMKKRLDFQRSYVKQPSCGCNCECK
jgi:hypothetical protein